MTQPMIMWCMIAGVLLCAFVLRAVDRYHAGNHSDDRRPHRFVEMGRERDIFYIPGDMDDDDSDDE